jgi:AcrR family transcriptional regulator
MEALTDTAAYSRADATRARLLEAAIIAFAEKGFRATTTRDIAAVAGLSPAGLYVYHKSKEELLYLISLAGHEHVLRMVQDTIVSIDDPVEAIQRVVHDFSVHQARNQTRSRIVNFELAALSPEHLGEINELRRRIDLAVRELVEAGVAAGVFDTPDPRMAGTALVSLGVDIARWYRDDGGWSPEYIGERYAEIALRIVGARQ